MDAYTSIYCKKFTSKILRIYFYFSLYGRYDFANKIIEIVNLKLSIEYKKCLNKVMWLQKRKKAYYYYLNLFMNWITGDNEANFHLIY